MLDAVLEAARTQSLTPSLAAKAVTSAPSTLLSQLVPSKDDVAEKNDVFVAAEKAATFAPVTWGATAAAEKPAAVSAKEALPTPNSHVRQIASVFRVGALADVSQAMGGETMWDYANGSEDTRFDQVAGMYLAASPTFIPETVLDANVQLGLGDSVISIKPNPTDPSAQDYTFAKGVVTTTTTDGSFALKQVTVGKVTLPGPVAAAVVERRLGTLVSNVSGSAVYRFTSGVAVLTSPTTASVDTPITRASRSTFDAGFRLGLGELTGAAVSKSNKNQVIFSFGKNTLTVENNQLVSMKKGKDVVPGSVLAKGAGAGPYLHQTRITSSPYKGGIDYAFQYTDIIVDNNGDVVE